MKLAETKQAANRRRRHFAGCRTASARVVRHELHDPPWAQLIPLHCASAEVLDQELTGVTPPISPCADREPADALHVLIEIADHCIHRKQPNRRLDRRRCFRLDEPEELPKCSPHGNLTAWGRRLAFARWQMVLQEPQHGSRTDAARTQPSAKVLDSADITLHGPALITTGKKIPHILFEHDPKRIPADPLTHTKRKQQLL